MYFLNVSTKLKLIVICLLSFNAERREPMRDEDCFWDYAKARCGRPDRCEYRYLPAFASVYVCTGFLGFDFAASYVDNGSNGETVFTIRKLLKEFIFLELSVRGCSKKIVPLSPHLSNSFFHQQFSEVNVPQIW